MNNLGIDVKTKGAKRLVMRLAQLKTTTDISGPHPYREDQSFSQIHITTTMSEHELDNWLYTRKHGADYVGTYTRRT